MKSSKKSKPINEAADIKYVAQLIKCICEKNYAGAHKYLKHAVDHKLMSQIQNTVSQ